MSDKPTLYASAPTWEQIMAIVGSFYGGSSVIAVGTGQDGLWHLAGTKGLLSTCIRKVGKRYRLESRPA